MTRFVALIIAIAIISVASLAGAAESTTTYTCSLGKAFECTPYHGCQEWSVVEMTLPRFVRVDLDAKTIVSLDKEVSRDPTKIAAIEKLEGMIVLNGIELRSWSMSIAENTGDLSLTAVGEGEVFSVFGSCISP